MQEVNTVSKYSIWAANMFAHCKWYCRHTAVAICDLLKNIVTKKVQKKAYIVQYIKSSISTQDCVYSKQNSKDQASLSLSLWWNKFKNQQKIYF